MSPRRAEAIEREPRHRSAVGWLLTAAVAAILVVTVWNLPRGDDPLPAIARYALVEALPDWHTTEPVNEVVYGTRGFDTFGETFLLLAAVVGVSLVCRAREPRRGFIGEEVAGRREQRTVEEHEPPASATERDARRAEAGEEGDRREARPVTPDNAPLGTAGPETAEAMTVVVRTGVRFVAPVLTTAGLYLVAWGYSPGGGFPGGTVMLGVALLAYVSLGYRRVEPVLRPGVMEPLELAGAMAIVLIGVLGLALTGSFMANFLPLGPPQTIRSGGILQAFSVSELVEVAIGLILVVFGLLGMGHDWTPDDGDGRDATSGKGRRR
jgi:multicomponent Na+:H+ antiporter subunit B